MITEDNFKKSPLHDKRAILAEMDKLEPKEMGKVVDLIQQLVNSYDNSDIIKSVCAFEGCNHSSTCGDFCWQHCNCKTRNK